MRLIVKPSDRPLAYGQASQGLVGERTRDLRRLDGGQEPIRVSLSAEGLGSLCTIRRAVVHSLGRVGIAHGPLDTAHDASTLVSSASRAN
jgi:hypothetical protein